MKVYCNKLKRNINLDISQKDIDDLNYQIKQPTKYNSKGFIKAMPLSDTQKRYFIAVTPCRKIQIKSKNVMFGRKDDGTFLDNKGPKKKIGNVEKERLNALNKEAV
jgi:hypothetical protein|tara:strand:+ start:369 stop:686 length:318 start_codon:yes stop_codon:yes gene_type:complete